MTISDESKPGVDDIVAALLRDAGTIDLRGNKAQLFIQSVRRLAEGKPLTAQDVTEIAGGVGLSRNQAGAVLSWLAERNEEGDIVGLAGLSLKQWNHNFEVNGRHFTTWCALDTLYLPQIIRKDAKIRSVDPITDEKIHVTLAPDGVVEAPANAVISIVIPKIDQKGLESAEQIWSAFCSYSHYFTSTESARQWFQERHVEPLFLSVDEGFELAGKWFAQIIQVAHAL